MLQAEREQDGKLLQHNELQLSSPNFFQVIKPKLL